MGYLPMSGNEHFHRGYSLRPHKSKSLINHGIISAIKKRRRGVYRAVPVPQALIDTIDLAHGLREAYKRHKKEILDAFLWPFARNTAWRYVTAVMNAAGIPDGPHRGKEGRYALGCTAHVIPIVFRAGAVARRFSSYV